MASTNSLQANYDAELDFIDCMVTRLVDRGYIKRDALNQFCSEGNLQPEPPVQADPDYREPQISMQIFTEENHQPAPPIQDDKKDEYCKYIALHKAAVEGDWEKAKKFFEKNQEAVTANINSDLENALHVAIQAGGNKAIDFVKNLVEEMTIEDLEHKNVSRQTVLMYAAGAGNTRAAVILVEKHPRLLYICDDDGTLPVHMAASYDRKDTFQYLLSKTQDENDGVRPFAGESGVELVRQTRP
ncbi:uncharacterized protein LOC127805626 [Diospyros lotus]|uniref:uncharacterized protein LOC127805626 n=1 Tax=Diospyros lotus TaxID=55363 RepID=UPI0022599566|nr:uncharacterized protein LOC127805626 [Diospyros lotus]